MFTSLCDIKINTNNYIEEYAKNFSSLVNQKDKDRSCKIDKLMSEIMHKKLFEIHGDNDFKEKTYSEIRALLGVKPGRLLIKELMTLCDLFEEHISIKSGGKFFHYTNSDIQINLNTCSDDDYNALAGSKEVKCSKPKAIGLAHELIHELHYREEDIQKIARDHHAKAQKVKGYAVPDWIKDFEVYPNPKFQTATFEGHEKNFIFKNLSNLEEEHTILGVNISRFLKKKKITRLDVLSENAFLYAFNLLPRIDHQDARHDSVVENTQAQKDLAPYYQWLLLQLNTRNERIEKVCD